jgi:hypothetical protein
MMRYSPLLINYNDIFSCSSTALFSLYLAKYFALRARSGCYKHSRHHVSGRALWPQNTQSKKKKKDPALYSERRIRFEFLSITQQFAQNVNFRNYTNILFEMWARHKCLCKDYLWAFRDIVYNATSPLSLSSEAANRKKNSFLDTNSPVPGSLTWYPESLSSMYVTHQACAIKLCLTHWW